MKREHEANVNSKFLSCNDDIIISILNFIPFEQVRTNLHFVSKRLKEILENKYYRTITILNFPNKNINHLGFSAITNKFANITRLNLSDSIIGDQDLAILNTFTRLKELNLNNIGISDNGLMYLAQIHNLEALDLSNNEIDDNRLKHFEKASKIRSLKLSQNRITAIGLNIIARLTNLTHLYLDDNQIISDQGLGAILQLQNLKVLNLSGHNSIENITLNDNPLPNLTDLDLSKAAGLTDTDLENIAKLTTLKSLKLSQNRITAIGLNIIARLTNLTHLYLDDNQIISDQGLGAILQLQHLKVLNLSWDNRIENITLDDNHLPNLTDLDLSMTAGLTDTDLEHIAKLTTLKSLNVSDSQQISDEGLNSIKTLGLKKLGLELTNVKFALELKSSEWQNSLEELNISYNHNFADDDINVLRNILSLRNLKVIYIKEGHFSNKFFVTISKLPNITEIYTSAYQLADDQETDLTMENSTKLSILNAPNLKVFEDRCGKVYDSASKLEELKNRVREAAFVKIKKYMMNLIGYVHGDSIVAQHLCNSRMMASFYRILLEANGKVMNSLSKKRKNDSSSNSNSSNSNSKKAKTAIPSVRAVSSSELGKIPCIKQTTTSTSSSSSDLSVKASDTKEISLSYDQVQKIRAELDINNESDKELHTKLQPNYFWKDAEITDSDRQQQVNDFITNYNQNNSDKTIAACNYEEKEFKVEDGRYICFGYSHYIGFKIENNRVSIFDSVTESETSLIKAVKNKIREYNLVQGHRQQLANQCWGRAFLYLAEDKADVDGNDANTYMNEKYLEKLKSTLLEHDQEVLSKIYSQGGNIKTAATLDIGTMTKLIEYHNKQNPSKQIRIVLVNDNGDMKLSQKNNKLLSAFSYDQYQELLKSDFTEITENEQRYILSEDEYARVLDLLPGAVNNDLVPSQNPN